MREITVDAGTRQLAARRFFPSGPRSGAAILFIHGAGSDQIGYRARAEAASERLGANCLTFDLGGHGASEGDAQELSARDHLHDCIAAFEVLLADEDTDPDRVGVCGASYGGFLASLLTASRGIRSLLLRAPGLYPDGSLDRPQIELRSSVETPETSAALRALRVLDAPVLVLESEHDETIGHDVIEAYVRACRNVRHDRLLGTGHQLIAPAIRTAFVDKIVEWFGETLTRDGAGRQQSSHR
jgi:pimeloyl-ACP methyl ester carboxylesterase